MPSSSARLLASNAFLTTTLLAGTILRLTGFTRGTVGSSTEALSTDGDSFYRFHPDEDLVIGGALVPFDWLTPPFTVYGILPVHLLRLSLYVSGWIFDWPHLDPADPDSVRRIYYVARGLAILFSVSTMVLVWVIAKRHMGRLQGSLAVALVAYAPGTVQQAHFFIVDGLFLFAATAAVGAIIEAAKTRAVKWFAVSGLLIGAAITVRMNGVALAAILSIFCLVGHGGILARESRRSALASLAVAGVFAVATVLLVQPHMFFRPDLLLLANAPRDFSLAVQFARGEILQPWNLIDYHALPYVYHWTDLLPLAIGVVGTAFGALSVLHAVRVGGIAHLALFMWLMLYFLQFGGLLAKSVRYVIPMVPVIAILSADLLAHIRSRRQLLGVLLIAVVVMPTAAAGISFGRVYMHTDSRLLAARWIDRNVPAGSSVGVEGGGFPLHGLLNESRIEKTWLDLPHIFYTSPYLLCSNRLDLLRQRLERMDYLAVIDANRMAQYRAVPDLFPVVAGFYEKLAGERLGFELVKRYKASPGLFGLRFDDSGSEPSFIGYDHPAVLIYRAHRSKIDMALESWRRELINDDNCSDKLLHAAATDLRSGSYDSARLNIADTQSKFPYAKTAYLLEAEIHSIQGRHAASAAARRMYDPESGAGGTLHASNHGTIHLIPGASALALVELGLEELAVRILDAGLEEVHRYDEEVAKSMASSYSEVAKMLFEKNRLQEMEQTLSLSLRVHQTSAALNVLGTLAYGKGKTSIAMDHWNRSLAIDDQQPQIHALLGKANLDQPGGALSAYHHLQRAILHDSNMASHLKPWLERANALSSRP
jgi:tetratricopeptide (TPR) repeat protein